MGSGKTKLEVEIKRNSPGKELSFCLHTDSKRLSKENVGLLLNGMRDLVRAEKLEMLSAFLSSVFPKTPVLREWEGGELPEMNED